jgi:hypothetical protein
VIAARLPSRALPPPLKSGKAQHRITFRPDPRNLETARFPVWCDEVVLSPLDSRWADRRPGRRHIGAGKLASVLGAPLPLCSCGVLPTALGLRKQGSHPWGDGRIPRRHLGNRGRQYQPYLRPDGPGHDRVSAHSRCRNGHRSRACHQPFRCSTSTPGRNPAAAAGR